MSEWKTRITKIQVPRPEEAGEAACLVLIYPPGPDMGKRFPLDREEIVLGRGQDCDIQVDRDSVSRKHARISGEVDDNGSWKVKDLNSTNGSYVNDRQIEDETRLRDGDFLKIGAAIFKFLTGDNVEMSYHEEIYRLTIVDGLTGVHNKRYFVEFLDREMARCERHGRPLSLAMFDIDHFKKINDQHGHLTGDYVLKEMARRLSARIRRDELLARYGGEEFAAVLPETDRAGALDFGEQIRKLVASEPFVFEGDSITVTISVGIAVMEGPSELGAFVKMADENLYRAKRGGRNQVVG